MGFRSK